ncbi:hypothetical protein RQP46_005658 [Phenoliferia psychrophenolica]
MTLTLLHALSYVATGGAFLFVLLSLASGLLYIAEVIEEHSGTAKAFGQRAIYAILVLLILLYALDGIPLHLTLIGLVSHAVYLQNFSRAWPSISLVSPAFIASCLLVVIDHFVAFNHFSHRAREPRRYTPPGQPRRREETFTDVATYFGVCVWLVPMFLFLSLSANDNVLPSAGTHPLLPLPHSPS